MTNGTTGFVKTIRVGDFAAGASPIDITDIIRTVDPAAAPRILSRIEVHKADGQPPPASPKFFSIERRCNHEGCNILKGGNWGTVSRPIVFSMLGANGIAYAVIECPCHGSRFDLTTGARLLGPATKNLARFETRVEPVNGENYVFVAIAAMADGNV